MTDRLEILRNNAIRLLKQHIEDPQSFKEEPTHLEHLLVLFNEFEKYYSNQGVKQSKYPREVFLLKKLAVQILLHHEPTLNKLYNDKHLIVNNLDFIDGDLCLKVDRYTRGVVPELAYGRCFDLEGWERIHTMQFETNSYTIWYKCCIYNSKYSVVDHVLSGEYTHRKEGNW